MKTRITLSIDPQAAQRAKQLAHARNTSVSALIEAYVRTAPLHMQDARQPFSRRWGGRFRVASSSSPDPRLDALKARYDLGD